MLDADVVNTGQGEDLARARQDPGCQFQKLHTFTNPTRNKKGGFSLLT